MILKKEILNNEVGKIIIPVEQINELLTDREIYVVNNRAKGKTYKVIGVGLGVSLGRAR